MHRRLRIALTVLVAVVLVAVGGFLVWARPQPLLPEATAALVSTPTVAFTAAAGGSLTYAPTASDPVVGLILYPGGKVPPAAYAPQAQAIAGHGYLVVVVSVPLNLAVFDIDAARPVIEAHPEIRAWAVGGHSLGGSMAAQYVSSHPGQVAGLVLWASYSAADLSGAGLSVASMYGTLDAGVANYTSPANLAKLGSRVTVTPIDGGNHEQMGWYTGQPNDPPATISRVDQQRAVVAATLALLEAIRPATG